MGKFEELHVWQESKNLAIEIYRISAQDNFSKDFGLRDQIRKAAVSIASNIAEGDELDTNKQSNRHFHIAKGSAAEVITQLIIAKEIGYITPNSAVELIAKAKKISAMLNKLIKARS